MPGLDPGIHCAPQQPLGLRKAAFPDSIMDCRVKPNPATTGRGRGA
jgi:hypothetical protein